MQDENLEFKRANMGAPDMELTPLESAQNAGVEETKLANEDQMARQGLGGFLEATPGSNKNSSVGSKASDRIQSQKVYDDTQSMGCIAPISVFAALVIFGLEMGFSVALAAVTFGVYPISKVCECPSNAFNFDETAVFYEGCVQNTTEQFKLFNAVPQNQTIKVDGWFYSTEFTRENLRSVKMEATVQLVDHEPPDLYFCPVFRPFWWHPIDWVGVTFMIVGQTFITLKIAQSRIRKNTIFVDRVEVQYFFGGGRMAVPLYAIRGEPTDHELKGLPPVRDCALAISTIETIKFEKDGTITSTVLKKGKVTDFRVEPSNLQAFKSALTVARNSALKKTYFFSDKFPASANDQLARRINSGWKDTTSAVTSEIVHITDAGTAVGANSTNYIVKQWTGVHRAGYWIRAIFVMFLFGVVGQFLLKCFFFVVRELVDPGRPKAENEFGNALLTVGPESWSLIVLVLVSSMIAFLNGIPTNVMLTGDSFIVIMDRAQKLLGEDFESYSLIVPRSAVVSAHLWSSYSACEKSVRCLFTELGTPHVKAKQWYTTKESKSKIVVKKYKADSNEGKEIGSSDLSYWQFLVPGSQETQGEFLSKLPNATE